MPETAKPRSAPDRGSPGRGSPGREPEQAARDRQDRDRDHAARSEDPPTGGLTAVLGKLRDAAAAHDDELSDPDGLPQHG
ncbi:MAG TPA: hypothetical protein VFX25_34925 [Streptosporangiaceae bacterium]|nr:hypothetical protein [Streptosporangiaceae bacterium]